MFRKQARQESNLQPPVLEPTPSNAGVAAFVDFQRLSFWPPTPALLDNAGVGTNPGTEAKTRAGDGRGAALRSPSIRFVNAVSGGPRYAHSRNDERPVRLGACREPPRASARADSTIGTAQALPVAPSPPITALHG